MIKASYYFIKLALVEYMIMYSLFYIKVKDFNIHSLPLSLTFEI